MLACLTLLLECLLLAILQANGIEERPVGAMLMMIAVFSFVYFWGIGRSRKLRPVVLPLVLGYLMRLFLLLFDLYGRDIYSLPNSGADSEMFYQLGIQYTFGVASQRGVFVAVVGTLFSRMGDTRIFVQFLLMLCSMVAIHMADAAMRELRVENRRRKYAMYVLCLLPNFGIVSSIFLRESLVTMFISISLVCFVRWLNGRSDLWFLLAFVFSFAAARFHSGSVAVAVSYIVVRLLYNKKRGVFRLTWQSIVPAIFFMLVFVFLFNNYSDTLFGKMTGVDSLEDIANTSTVAGSSYAAYVGNSSTPLNMLLYTPLRLVFFLFAPFPWQWRGLSDIIAFCFSSMFYLLVLVRAVSYLKKREQKNRQAVIALLIVALATAFVFAWGVVATGTAIRHRDKMVIVYGVLLSLTSPVPGTAKIFGKGDRLYEPSGANQCDRSGL